VYTENAGGRKAEVRSQGTEEAPDEARREAAFPLLFAVNMLVNTEDGDTFTFGEYRKWLEEAGFRDVRTLEAPSPSPLILATKA
jgi:hypothetical protein